MNIAYVLCTTERGGVEEHVLSLIKHINPRRFRCFLVAPERLLRAFDGDLTDKDAGMLPLALKGFGDLKGLMKAVRFFRKERIHIVNTHMFYASAFYAPAARCAGVPVVIETSHGVEKWRFEKGFVKRHSYMFDKLISLLQDRILAVSHACARDLVRIKKINARKIAVVQNGRDLASFSPAAQERRRALRLKHGLGEEDYVFGVLARLGIQKGHAYLFEAIRLLAERRRDFKVLLVGDGPLRSELQESAERLRITPFVIFAGFQNDMPGYHGMIDVNVLPSLYEGLPLGLVEAAALERPVIATAVDGTPEVVTDRRNGLLVPPKDPRALCDAMAYALDHPEEMKEMGRRGREIALRHFTLERQIRETEQVYEELAARAGFGGGSRHPL